MSLKDKLTGKVNGKGSIRRKYNKKKFDQNWDFYVSKRICKHDEWKKRINKKDIEDEE
jgi:hypothetical protein